MRFLKNNIWTLGLMAVFCFLALTGNAAAQDGAASSSIMEHAESKALSVFMAVRSIIFVVGGFGLVGIAFAAVFGKVNWKWFASLAVGLAILAAAGAIVTYATGDEANLGGNFSASTGVGVTE